MQTTYRSGQWFVLVLPSAVVALPPETADAVVTELWERMPQNGTLATVVDALSAHAGGVFASLPSFVAAVREVTGIRVALRGAVTAHVTAVSGPQEFSGADVTTWSERFVAGASQIEITLDGVEAELPLPVRSGVVRAAHVTAELEAPVEDASAEAPEVDAGVVERPEVSEVPEPATEQAAPPAPERAAPPLIEPTVAAAPDPVAEPAIESLPEPARESAPAPQPQPEPTSTPEQAPAAASVVEDVSMIPSEVTLAPPAEDFDQLWGATVHSAPSAPVQGVPAAIAGEGEPGAGAEPAAPQPAQRGDHDGSTISTAAMRALRQQAAPAEDAPVGAPPEAAATATGRIRVSTGQVVTLDRTVIIGRRPRSTRASGANLPHLIAVDSPQQDISRSHLEIRPEGDTVVVIDLHTTNGSTLLRAGADPVRLHPGEHTLVVSGDVVDLGDGIEVAFEGLP